jgi:hypothetical protein
VPVVILFYLLLFFRWRDVRQNVILLPVTSNFGPKGFADFVIDDFSAANASVGVVISQTVHCKFSFDVTGFCLSYPAIFLLNALMLVGLHGQDPMSGRAGGGHSTLCLPDSPLL